VVWWPPPREAKGVSSTARGSSGGQQRRTRAAAVARVAAASGGGSPSDGCGAQDWCRRQRRGRRQRVAFPPRARAAADVGMTARDEVSGPLWWRTAATGAVRGGGFGGRPRRRWERVGAVPAGRVVATGGFGTSDRCLGQGRRRRAAADVAGSGGGGGSRPRTYHQPPPPTSRHRQTAILPAAQASGSPPPTVGGGGGQRRRRRPAVKRRNEHRQRGPSWLAPATRDRPGIEIPWGSSFVGARSGRATPLDPSWSRADRYRYIHILDRALRGFPGHILLPHSAMQNEGFRWQPYNYSPCTLHCLPPSRTYSTVLQSCVSEPIVGWASDLLASVQSAIGPSVTCNRPMTNVFNSSHTWTTAGGSGR